MRIFCKRLFRLKFKERGSTHKVDLTNSPANSHLVSLTMQQDDDPNKQLKQPNSFLGGE